MWTYLVILASLSLVFGVFLRRIILEYKGAKPPADNLVTEPEAEDFSKDAEKVSKTNKKLVEKLCEKAAVKSAVGNEDEAIKLLVQALAIDQLNIEAQHMLAMLYMGKKMYTSASALFESLSQITQDPVHHSHLGLALYQQSDFENAKRAYQKAISLDDSRPQRFVSLCQVYRSLGQPRHAIVALSKAMALEPNNIDFLFLLSELELESKNVDGAINAIRRILEIDGDNKDAKAQLKVLSR